MNQLCRVCGEPAAGFHFGAFTCEGCKSFFGRTYNNLGSISECKNNGECVINKKNRTSCKACRLRKCLLVGMSKSGSRYGRRSNWFKIHCLLQEQQQQGNPVSWDSGKMDADNNNTPPKEGGWPRGGLLPLHHPALPFLTPPFLHPPHLHPNFFPFLPRPPAPPSPQSPPRTSLDVLRSLGPVQEAPMDLSTCSRSPPRARTPEVTPPKQETPPEFQEERKTGTPLDLTCVK